jgi:hypothetical protein
VAETATCIPKNVDGIVASGIPPEGAWTPDPDIDRLVGEFVAVLAIVTLPVTLPADVGAKVTVSAIDCPAVSVCADVTPVVLKPAPDIVTCEIVTLEFPEFVSVTFCELVLPTVTLLKLRLVGFAVTWSVAATPAPLSAMAVGDVGALFANDRLPVTLPEAEGAKATVIVPEPPAAIVIGSDRPLVLKPEPVTFAAVMDRLALPVFETVNDCFPLPPTVTLPNVRLPGVTEICGEDEVPVPAGVPVPARVTVVGEFPAVLVIFSVPVAAPDAVGVNVTLRVRPWPAFNVIGRVVPEDANGPEMVTALTVIEPELLLFVSVTFCVPLLPTVSLPKLSELGLAESCRVGTTPVPLSAIAVGDVGASLVNDRLPVPLPEVEGAKLTVIVPEPPAATVIGSDRPLVLKPEPVTFAAVMDRLALPVFETVSDCFPLPPTVTLPNVRLPGVTEICAPGPEDGDLVAVAWPTQLERLTPDKSTAAKMRDANLVLVRIALKLSAEGDTQSYCPGVQDRHRHTVCCPGDIQVILNLRLANQRPRPSCRSSGPTTALLHLSKEWAQGR